MLRVCIVGPLGQALVAERQDEELVVERDQVGPAVGLAGSVRNQGSLLAKEFQPRLQPAHRAGWPFDEEGYVLERSLHRLGRVAGGEADVGPAHEGSRHFDHELLKHQPKLLLLLITPSLLRSTEIRRAFCCFFQAMREYAFCVPGIQNAIGRQPGPASDGAAIADVLVLGGVMGVVVDREERARRAPPPPASAALRAQLSLRSRRNGLLLISRAVPVLTASAITASTSRLVSPRRSSRREVGWAKTSTCGDRSARSTRCV